MKLTVDTQADAAYLELSDEPVESTCQVSEEVLVDLDADGLVVGVEVLRMDAVVDVLRLFARRSGARVPR